MPSNNLSPSNIITVTLQGVPAGLAVPNINTVALISQEVPVWAGTQDYAVYKDPTSVAQDFGSNSKAAAIANAFFSQNPNPIQTQGYLVIIPRLQSIAVAAGVQIQDIQYQAVATGVGGNSITIAYTTGGTAGQEAVSVISNAISVQIASGVSTAAQIAAAIAGNTAAAALVTATVFGVASNKQTAPVSATNLTGGSASGLEPVHTAMIRTVNEVYYFGVILDFIPTAPFTTLPAYVQGANQMLFAASNSKADILSNGILGSLAGKAQNLIRGLYYNDGTAADTINFAAAYASRGLSVDFSGSLTAFTMHLKQLIGFAPDTTLAQTDLLTAQANGIDVYPPFGFQGETATGNLYTSGANGFFDQIYNQMWLKFALQVAGFNFLAQVANKIPQTEVGMEGLKNAYRSVMNQAVSNGIVSPGGVAWNSPTVFGNVANLYRSVLDIGYYVYSQPVSQQLAAQRALRIAPLIQIAAKMAGAIHSSSVIVQVNL
jgi:hypothetical protein